MIRVRATQLGYYGGALRDEDDEFDVATEKDLGSWMERLDKKSAKSKHDDDEDAEAKAKAKADAEKEKAKAEAEAKAKANANK